MIISINWLELSQQLTATFGHFLWQGAAIGIALSILLRLMSRRSAGSRYATACVTLTLLPVCVVATFIVVHRDGGSIVVAQAAPRFAVRPETMDAPALPPSNEVVTTHSDDSGDPEAAPVRVPTEATANIERVSGTAPPTTGLRDDLLRQMSPYLTGVYLIGVLALSGRFLMAMWGGHRLQSMVTEIRNAGVLRAIQVQAQQMALKRVPLVAMCERVAVPVVVGVLRPMILFPPALMCGLDVQQLSAILAHEMAHIQRHDPIVNLMQRVIECLLFFHPVTWWVSRVISEEREMCCDDLASGRTGRLEYAAALLRMAEVCAERRGLNLAPQLKALAATGTSRTQLGLRIRRLLGEDTTPRPTITRRALMTSAVFISLLGVSVVAYEHSDKGEVESTSSAQAASDASVDTAAYPVDQIIWWDAGHGLEAGFLLVAPSQPNQRVPSESLVTYQVVVRNRNHQTIRFLARQVPHKNADAPYLIPADNITEAINAVSLPHQFRAESASPHSPQSACIVELQPGESAIITNQHSFNQNQLYVGAGNESHANAAHVKVARAGMNWIVQPLQIHVPAPTDGMELTGESCLLTKIDSAGNTHQEVTSRVQPNSGGSIVYPRIQLEVGTLNAAAVRNAPLATWGKVESGLQCGIRMMTKKQQYHIGDMIEAEVLWRNVSDAAISAPHPQQMDLYPVIRNAAGGNETIDFGARFNLIPPTLPINAGEVRSIGTVRIRFVEAGTPSPASNQEPSHVTLDAGRYTLLCHPGVSRPGTTGPVSGELSFVVVGEAVTESQAGKSAGQEAAGEAVEAGQKNQAAGPGDFSGTVAGPDGQPFAGANIYAVSNKGDADEPGLVRAITDAEGRFQFSAPDLTYHGYDGLPLRRETLVIAVAGGLAPDWMVAWGNNTSKLREYWTPREGDPIELQLARDEVPIQGRLLDADGKPLADAQVRLDRLMVPDDRDLTAHLEHWSKASVMAGFLTKVPSYKRELSHTERLPNVQLSTTTDADGRFEFTGLGTDRVAILDVKAPSVIDTSIQVMTRRAENVGMFLDLNNEPTQTVYGADFTLQLKQGLTITGVVRDRDTQQPVAGMWVTKYYNPLTHPEQTRAVTTTDVLGRFTLSGLDPKLLDYEEKHRLISAIPQPGVPYLMARTVINGEPLTIECVRGVPFRLKVVDQDSVPVEATVEYRPVKPNSQSEDLIRPLATGSNWPVMSRAARRGDGTYEGFALPGPGAILVTMPNSRDYRPALVDTKAFFEPGRTNWPGDADQVYGTRDTVQSYDGMLDQNQFDAIALVNPSADSEPLDLTATVYRDQPRVVSLVDESGQAVDGVDSRMLWPGRETREVLRSATFDVRGLHPDRIKHMRFYKDDHELVGALEARGDGASPYTVVMKKWSVLTGRVLIGSQPAAKARLTIDGRQQWAYTDEEGRFEIDKVVPDHAHEISIQSRTMKSEPLRKIHLSSVTVAPGQTRDLGDLTLTMER